jgi:hypothetical protein
MKKDYGMPNKLFKLGVTRPTSNAARETLSDELCLRAARGLRR